LPGKLVYLTDGQLEEIILPAGVMHVFKNRITIFTASSHRIEDDDDERKIKEFDDLSRMLMQSLDAGNAEYPHGSVEE
jgi:hypothetical protein